MKSSPEEQALQKADTPKKIRESLPPDRWLRPTRHPLCLLVEPDNRAIGWSRKVRSSAETQTPRGVLVGGPDPECRNRGRIWRHSLIGAQYCCGFRRADVCPIPPEHSRRLRSTLGRIRGALPSDNLPGGVRWLKRGVGVETIDRAKVHVGVGAIGKCLY
jgi:hypothetical protein